MRGLPTYLLGLLALMTWATVVGVAGPHMISAPDTGSVLLGIGVVFVLPVALLLIYRWWRSTRDAKRILRSAKRMVPLLLVGLMLGACSKVPAGNVGVIVNLYGSEKGVSEKEVGVGKYWVGWNEDLFVFPTFTQTDTWAKTEKKDESIVFQTGKDGMVMSADFGITFRVDPSKVARLFQTYRKGVDEISDIFLRNLVRDAVNEKAADLTADEAYGRRKNEMMDAVEASVRREVADKGIIIEKVYLVGDIRLPAQVRAALDAKNSAFQKTLQREQEVAQAKAEADSKIAEARGRAESVLVEARAQADANRILSASITPELVQYRSIDRWDGVLPRITGNGVTPLVDVDKLMAPPKSAKSASGVVTTCSSGGPACMTTLPAIMSGGGGPSGH